MTGGDGRGGDQGGGWTGDWRDWHRHDAGATPGDTDPDGPTGRGGEAPDEDPVDLGPRTGPITVPQIVPRGAVGQSPLLFEPRESTPFERGESGDSDGLGGTDETGLAIPGPLLWALKFARHGLSAAPGDDTFLRARVGDGDDAVYLLDDGPRHAMVGRVVGESTDDITYCLVGRLGRLEANDLVVEELHPTDAFDFAREVALLSVFRGAASNVVPVERYRRARDIPPEYLPGAPEIEFVDEPGDGDADGEGEG